MALFPQQSDMLCWAASAQMIAKAFRIDADQCSQVRAQVLSPSSTCTNCLICTTGSSSTAYGACNHGGWPDFDRLNLHADRTVNRALTFDQLKKEIACNHRAVAFSWHTGPETGHMMVAYGYDGDYVDILNPADPCVGNDTLSIKYDMYAQGDNPGTSWHWDDFYGIRPRAE